MDAPDYVKEINRDACLFVGNDVIGEDHIEVLAVSSLIVIAKENRQTLQHGTEAVTGQLRRMAIV